MFDLSEIFEFQKEHDIQILKGEDCQYMCYIDKKVYGTALTIMGALVFGIKIFKNK
jgi:hypothetical protein